MLTVDPAVFEARLGEVENVLAGEDISALVVYAQGSALGWAGRMHGYLRFLSDWDSHHYSSVLIVIPGVEPVVLTPNKFLHYLAAERTHLTDVRYAPVLDFGREIVTVLKAAGLGLGRVGYIGRSETPVPVWEDLVAGLGEAEWVDVSPHLDRMRMVKDEGQLAFHRRAAEICDKMCEGLGPKLRSGKAAYQVSAELERIGTHEGCEYCLTWLTVRPEADCARLYKRLGADVPKPGDQVVLGIYLMVDGHWGHAIRTGNLGPLRDDHKILFDVTLEMADAGLAKLGPGADLNDVEAAFESVFQRHCPDAKERNIFRFCNAHGLGHSYEEAIVGAAFPQPYASAPKQEKRPDPITAQAGMLFEFHPNIFIPGLGGAAIGDMVLVTETGNEILTRFPRRLSIW
ncbi:MAG: M24 family metallopeptidase [Rhodospirillales bacterium]|jgi:Xaa-Pro aminopeptidase|nr:M24 family metallopeptidase [Rhodospirillales bacterium]